jgi:hypothetical protein
MSILGKIRYNLKGDWQVTTVYNINDTVIYNNRNYRCIQSNSNNPPPSAGFWELMSATFNDQGSWVYSTSYAVGDVVTYDTGFYANTTYPRNRSNVANGYLYTSNTYVALVQNNNINPIGNTNTWGILSQGASKNYKAFLWAPNQGQVPAGFYPGNAAPGWANTTFGTNAARPGDSYYDGGRGGHYAGSATFFPDWINRNGGIVHFGPGQYGTAGYGANQDGPAEYSELSLTFNEWYDGSLPTPDGDVPKVIQYDGMYGNRLVLFNNGEVYYWGYNGNGQGTTNTTAALSVPIRWGNNNITQVMRGIKAIRTAITHRNGPDGEVSAAIYVLTANNYTGNSTANLQSTQVWSNGYNGYGQLGDTTTTAYTTPKVMLQTNFNAGETAVDVWACGSDYGSVYVYTNQGNLYATGYNASGQLGIGSTTNPNILTFVKQFTGGIRKFFTSDWYSGYVSVGVIDGNNQLWTWGYNNVGQLGTNDATARSAPYQVSYNGTNVTNAWFSQGGNPSLYVTRNVGANTNQVFCCGNNLSWNLGRLQTALNTQSLISGYTPEISHGQNGGSASTNADGTVTVPAFYLNTYRLEPMYVEYPEGGAPYYANIANVVMINAMCDNSGQESMAILEQVDGTKYITGSNVYGQFGTGFGSAGAAAQASFSGFLVPGPNADSVLGSARATSTQLQYNCLPKKHRFYPTGVQPSEFQPWLYMSNYAPYTGSSSPGVYWSDKWGTVYYAGTAGGYSGYHILSPQVPNAAETLTKMPLFN